MSGDLATKGIPLLLGFSSSPIGNLESKSVELQQKKLVSIVSFTMVNISKRPYKVNIIRSIMFP